jgi:hypothetical protein
MPGSAVRNPTDSKRRKAKLIITHPIKDSVFL